MAPHQQVLPPGGPRLLHGVHIRLDSSTTPWKGGLKCPHSEGTVQGPWESLLEKLPDMYPVGLVPFLL